MMRFRYQFPEGVIPDGALFSEDPESTILKELA
jgi:hypothetical protein